MDGEIIRVVEGRSVIGSLARIMEGRNVTMEIKRGLRNNILLPLLIYKSKTWTWTIGYNTIVKSALCGNELRGTFDEMGEAAQ